MGLSNSEEAHYVSMVEGSKHPLIGFAFRPDKTMYVFEQEDKVDHSHGARRHSQKIAHFFVDQARLSDNVVDENVLIKQVNNLKKIREGKKFYFEV